MGWEYDGDEDAFWRYCDSVAPYENNYDDGSHDYHPTGIVNPVLKSMYEDYLLTKNGFTKDILKRERKPFKDVHDFRADVYSYIAYDESGENFINIWHVLSNFEDSEEEEKNKLVRLKRLYVFLNQVPGVMKYRDLLRERNECAEGAKETDYADYGDLYDIKEGVIEINKEMWDIELSPALILFLYVNTNKEYENSYDYYYRAYQFIEDYEIKNDEDNLVDYFKEEFDEKGSFYEKYEDELTLFFTRLSEILKHLKDKGVNEEDHYSQSMDEEAFSMNFFNDERIDFEFIETKESGLLVRSKLWNLSTRNTIASEITDCDLCITSNWKEAYPTTLEEDRIERKKQLNIDLMIVAGEGLCYRHLGNLPDEYKDLIKEQGIGK